ncbi:MAG: peptide chain release factor N(5)-glutamine methyltransferase [Ferrovum sp.]|nr:peptide chain release factor N(5)-glutamine methyltransferase [Ferrovum sp.]
MNPTLNITSVEELLNFSATSPSDTRLLLQHVLQKNHAWIKTHLDAPLTTHQHHQFVQSQRQLAQGVPLAYILEEKAFYKHLWHITPDVLIPRPETEHLIEWALERMHLTQNGHLIELGTGSGIIAISLQAEKPRWTIWASDLSSAALSIAQTNAKRCLAPSQPTPFWYQSNWWQNIPPQTFDGIVSNPPYIAQNDPHLLQGSLPHEPQIALTPGPTGTEALEHLISTSFERLKPGGWLLLEHGFDQGSWCQNIFKTIGFRQVETRQDLAGLDRMTGGYR